jgi:hypothetical protein
VHAAHTMHNVRAPARCSSSAIGRRAGSAEATREGSTKRAAESREGQQNHGEGRGSRGTHAVRGVCGAHPIFFPINGSELNFTLLFQYPGAALFYAEVVRQVAYHSRCRCWCG